MFTNDKEELNKVILFREQAVEDDWKMEPTYPGYEDILSASTLTKNGFTMQIFSRERSKLKQETKWDYEVSVNIWGPDSMIIQVPDRYDWEEIIKGLRKCNTCGKKDVDTFRYSFAGRCCKECLPEMKKKYEYPGWTN